MLGHQCRSKRLWLGWCLDFSCDSMQGSSPGNGGERVRRGYRWLWDWTIGYGGEEGEGMSVWSSPTCLRPVSFLGRFGWQVTRECLLKWKAGIEWGMKAGSVKKQISDLLRMGAGYCSRWSAIELGWEWGVDLEGKEKELKIYSVPWGLELFCFGAVSSKKNWCCSLVNKLAFVHFFSGISLLTY